MALDASVSVVALRDQRHPGARDARAGHETAPPRVRAHLPCRRVRPEDWWGSVSVPTPLLVLFSPRCLHHDLPGFGFVSEIIPVFSRRRIFGYHFVVWSSVAIAVISFLVWGHHLFVAGTSLYSALVFSILSFLVAVPQQSR